MRFAEKRGRLVSPIPSQKTFVLEIIR